MKDTGTLRVATLTGPGIVRTRVFDAPASLVFEALTDPERVKLWFAPMGFPLASCQVDLRVGGTWGCLLRRPDGVDVGMFGAYREIVRPRRLVFTQAYTDWFAGVSLVTATLIEHGAGTTLTSTVLYPSQEIRDGIMTSGKDRGTGGSYDRLADYLVSIA